MIILTSPPSIPTFPIIFFPSLIRKALKVIPSVSEAVKENTSKSFSGKIWTKESLSGLIFKRTVSLVEVNPAI